jgi:hypothetical protein
MVCISGLNRNPGVEGRTATGSSDGNKLLKTGFHRRFSGVAERDQVLSSAPMKESTCVVGFFVGLKHTSPHPLLKIVATKVGDP